MRYVGDLITDSRSDTNNTDVSATVGIPTSDFLRYMNYAQENLQGVILHASPNTFQAEEIQSIVANQEAYTLTDNLYLGERIVNVEFSHDGTVNNYRRLREYPISERDSRPEGWIRGYIRRSGQLLMVPPRNTSQGSIRVTFERQLDMLDTRRGQVNGTPSGSIIDLTTGGGPSTTDEALFTAGAYVCLSKADGTVVLRNGLISSYNAGNDELTLSAAVSTYLVTGYVLADLANTYLTVGKWTTTHSKLPNNCERYLVAYTNWKVLGRDAASAAKAKIFEDEVSLIQTELVKSYQEASKDEGDIHIENPELMVGDDWQG